MSLYGLALLIAVPFGNAASAGSLKIIYQFQGGNDGASPTFPLVEWNGALYGTTGSGGGTGCGGQGCGILFSITLGDINTETIIHNFNNDGGFADSGLRKVDNALIGDYYTTSGGETFYEVKSSGNTFTFKTIGSVAESDVIPYYGMLQIGKVLYGAAIDGGTGCAPNGCGYIYAVTP
ncbi:MAG TPA: hypothetical protein VHU23_05910 [Rhizomicrobium sp.]|jgi:hypothetical protein|nr:hypothetical protein [Rhizomicrobium sp.]